MAINTQLPYEHPVHDTPGIDLGLDVNFAASLQNIAQRFEGKSQDEITTVLGKVGWAASWVHSHRLGQEEKNLQRIIAAVPRDSTIQARYQEYAGRSNHVGEFIHWFGHIANEAMDRVASIDNISLLLGKKTLPVFDGSAGALDAAIRSIPAQLKAIDPPVILSKLSDTDDVLAYRHRQVGNINESEVLSCHIVPLEEKASDRGGRILRDAIAFTRRGLLDAWLPRSVHDERGEVTDWLRSVETFKDDATLIKIRYLDISTRAELLRLYRDTPGRHFNNKNSVAATYAAGLIELAKVHPHKYSRAIIPIDTAYIASVKQDDRQSRTHA